MNRPGNFSSGGNNFNFGVESSMSSPESPVLGIYDKIEVRPSSVLHSGREVPITWINRFAFYFKWDPKNEQIWVYNENEDCLHQICKSVDAGILNSRHAHHGQTGGKNAFVQKQLGYFTGTTVHPSHVRHSGREVDITWINPLSFHFKWAEGNEQVWVYDSTVPGYLQLGQWPDAVKTVMQGSPERVHKLS